MSLRASPRPMQGPLAIAVEPDFDFASAAYDNLYRHASCTAFQGPEWLSAFYAAARGMPGVEPLILVGRDTAGAPKLVAPLIRRRRDDHVVVEYAFLGVTDYACAILAPELKCGAALAATFRAALGHFDGLDIAPVRAEDAGLWQALLGRPPESLAFGAHAAACEGPYDAWRAQVLGRARIAELARKARRLAECGPLQLRVAAPSEVDAAMQAAARFRAGRFADDPLQDVRLRAFYAEAARRGAAAGSARTYLLSCGESLAAMLFGLIRDGRFCYLLLACDYARFGRCSPGMLMFDWAMRDWFDGGGRIFDLTIGDEPFKARLGTARTPMYRFGAGR